MLIGNIRDALYGLADAVCQDIHRSLAPDFLAVAVVYEPDQILHGPQRPLAGLCEGNGAVVGRLSVPVAW